MMTEDELDQLHIDYRRALKAFNAADEEMGRMSQKLSLLSGFLSGKNTSTSRRNPLSAVQRVSIEKMPTSMEVLALHDDWAAKREALGAIWRKFPNEDKAALVRPPENAGNLGH